MDNDQKLSPMTPKSKQEDRSNWGNSRILDFPVFHNVSKSSHDKVENSQLTESEKEIKQTPRSTLKSEAYGLHIFDMIQNSIFKADQLASAAIEKESNQDINNILQERDSFVNLNILLGQQQQHTANQEAGATVEVQRETHTLTVSRHTSRNSNNPNIHIEVLERNENRPRANRPNFPNNNNDENIPNNNNNVGNNNNNREASPQQQQQANNNPNTNALQSQGAGAAAADADVAANNNIDESREVLNPKILRQLEFYFISLALYILGLIVLENYVDVQILLLVLVPWFLHVVYREVKFHQTTTLTVRQKRAKFFQLTELLFLAIYVIVGAIRVNNSNVKLAPATIPGFVNFAAWITLSDPPNSSSVWEKIKTGFAKIVIWVQLLLIGLRADGQIDTWGTALNLTYYLLFGFIFYSILVFFLFLSTILGCRRTDSSYRLNIIGFGWYFLVSIYSWVWFNLLINATGYMDDKKPKKSIKVALGEAIAHAAFLIIYATLLRNKLTHFLRFETSAFAMRAGSIPQNGIEKYVRFEIAQGDMPYLITISPTFYSQMKESFKMKNKTSLLEWISQIRKEKAKKYLRAHSKADTSKPPVELKISVRGEIDPQELDIKFPVKSPGTLRQDKDRDEPLSASLAHIRQDKSLDMMNQSKIFYSFDDMAIYDNIKKPVERKSGNLAAEGEKENTCYVCVERAPNAVFMECGHGGVCYECALESWKKSDTCIMCRQKINAILKVNIIEKLKVSKVIHATKKIVEER